MTEDQATAAIAVLNLIEPMRDALNSLQTAIASNRVIDRIDIQLDDGSSMHWSAQPLPAQASATLLTTAQQQFQGILNALLTQLAAI